MLVHHGYFWKGEDPRLCGMKYRRVKALLQYDISLIAYHLPLDAHPEIGNNARLGQLLGFDQFAVLDQGPAKNLLFYCQLEQSLEAVDLSCKIEQILCRKPLHIAGSAKPISKIAWCTGGAQSFIEQAVELGMDAFITGEASEQTTHIAMENKLHFFAAGHHATERYGVAALGDQLSRVFALEHFNFGFE